MSNNKSIIQTNNAPQAIGTYSQAVKAGPMVFISGQIALDPNTGEMQQSSMEAEIEQVFQNLIAIVNAAGAKTQDVVKITLFLTDLAQFGLVNDIMARHFSEPYPARAAVGVSALPKGARFEAEAIIIV
ncbi:MAG: Rid family detoxifying hydrolase [Gammaproteobacteria bacterium]